MELSLEKPPRKKWMLVATQLAGDEHFTWDTSPDSEDCRHSQRWVVNRIIVEESGRVGLNCIFNQFVRRGTTGWELKNPDENKVLAVAIAVGERLGVPVDIGEIWWD